MAGLPTFFGDGYDPRRSDTQWVILQKILGALTSGLGGGGSGTTGLSGSGSPEGVVTAAVGTTYVRTDTGGFWYKTSGSGNTGWTEGIV